MFQLNKLFLFSFSLAVIIFVNTSHAKEQVIATITQDQDSKSYQLIIDSEDGGRAIKYFYMDTFFNEKRILRESFDYHKIGSGITLLQSGSHNILNFQSDNFDFEQGGIINIDTLYNGVKGTRKNYEIALAKNSNGWILLNKGSFIKNMFIVSNKIMLVGSVGIKNIKMN